MSNATPKQQKLIKILIANFGKTGETKTLKEMLLEAGYSESTATNPHLILEGDAVQEGVSDFLSQLDDKRRRAITHITDEKLEGSSARDLAHIASKFTNDYQLLSGGHTENVKHDFSDYSDEELAKLANESEGS